MINNRQNGRRRGRGGQQVRNGQPGNQDRGNRIDNRARGNAAQLLEKYKSMAQEAQRQGDRVNTEYYLQFADHYFRVLAESRARFEEQRGGEQRAPRQDYRDEFGQDGGDYEAEGQRYDPNGDGWNDGEDERAPQQQPQQRQPEQRRPMPQPRFEEQAAGGEARFEGERRPRRQRNGDGHNGNGNGNAYAPVGAEAREGDDAPERIEIDRLPQSLGAAPAPSEAGAPDGEEGPPPPPPCPAPPPLRGHAGGGLRAGGTPPP